MICRSPVALLFSAALLVPLHSYAAGSVPEAIMAADAKGLFKSAYSSVDQRKSVSVQDFAGRKAAKIELRYEWKGGPLDWNRFGKPGYGQRSQFNEKESKRMVPNKDYWLTVSVFIPPELEQVKASLQLFDLKYVVDNNGSVPAMDFRVFPEGEVHAGVGFVTALSGEWKCGTYRNAEGGKTPICNRMENAGYMGKQAALSGRWIEMVAHLRFAKENGIVNIWFDKKPIYGVTGDTLKIAKFVSFKFGPYRIEMDGDPGPVALYYSHVARAGTCEALGVEGCSDLYAAPVAEGLQNLADTWSNPFNELDEMRAKGL